MTLHSSDAIEVSRLEKGYGGVAVIRDLSLSVTQGELVTLLGPSGCGKTTTLRCIAGFVAPDSGAIRIGGRDILKVPPYRRRLGMVFQSFALFPHMTVFNNVAFGLKLRSVARAELEERVRKALALVRLEGFADRMPKQLSGGQQQRVSLARALVYEPQVLLLDEPLSSLDAKLRVEMRKEIRDLQKNLGLAAIYVTHDQEEALSISDRVALMNDGGIEQLSAPWEMYNKPRTLFAASFIGTSNILPAQAAAGGQGRLLRLDDTLSFPSATCEIAEGDRCWAVIRPEAISIARSPESGSPAHGRLRAITMLGANLRFEIALREETKVLCDMPHDGKMPAIEPGDPVILTADPQRVVAIPRSDDQRR
jgi:putative spermidine/putrescine transport system ATP-binding protein